MKIGFFAFSLTGIGPRTRARTLIDNLADRDEHEVVLVTGPDERYSHPSINHYCINRFPSGLATKFRKIKNMFKNVDVVHVPVNLFQVMYVRALYKGPIVAGAGIQHEYFYRKLAKLLNIDSIIETHEYVAYMWEQSGFDCTPIYPSVDRDKFYKYDQSDRDMERSNLNIDDDEEAILYVGKLNEYKGAHIFDRLIQQLGPNQLAIVAGKGPLDARFTDRDDVRFQGYVENEDLPRLYNAADVTVVPSLEESFSLVSLESIACGTPVVTTTEDCTMERLFKHRDTYVWAEERSADYVLNAVNQLLDNEKYYSEQVKRGFATIQEMGLTISDTVDDHLSVYENVI